jgi:ribosomal protein S18 acetylase RimI-like enzyme
MMSLSSDAFLAEAVVGLTDLTDDEPSITSLLARCEQLLEPKDLKKVTTLLTKYRLEPHRFCFRVWAEVDEASVVVLIQTRRAFHLKASSTAAACRFIDGHLGPRIGEIAREAYFSSLTPELIAPLERAVGRPVEHLTPCFVFSLEGQNLDALLDADGPTVERVLAEKGFTVGCLEDTEADLECVRTYWPYSRGDPFYIQSRIQDGPTCAVRDATTGEIAAFAFTHPYRALAGLHVREHHRRKGLARQVVRQMAKRAVDAGDPVWLHTVEENQGGVALFKELGFKDIGRDTWAFWCDWAKVPPVG